jgi:hypothetical protein
MPHPFPGEALLRNLIPKPIKKNKAAANVIIDLKLKKIF